MTFMKYRGCKKEGGRTKTEKCPGIDDEFWKGLLFKDAGMHIWLFHVVGLDAYHDMVAHGNCPKCQPTAHAQCQQCHDCSVLLTNRYLSVFTSRVREFYSVSLVATFLQWKVGRDADGPMWKETFRG